MKRDLVVGVVGSRHDVHRVPGEVRHTVGYHACDGHIVSCDGSNEKNIIEGDHFYPWPRENKTIEFIFEGINMFWARVRFILARAVRRGLK